MFQLPYFPEFVCTGVNDMEMLSDLFDSPEMGIRNNRLTAEEIEAFKYSVGATEGDGGD